MSRTLVLISLLVLASIAAVSAGAKSGDAPYQTGYDSWRGFSNWSQTGTAVAGDGSLILGADSELEEGTDTPSGYYGGNRYNGDSYLVGTATSPDMPTTFDFTEAIASWNAATPAGTWIETWIQARIAGRWTKLYSLGVWTSSSTDSVKRHSVRLQGDTDGFVATDTLVLNGKKAPPADAYRITLLLFKTPSATVSPSVRFLSVATSTAAQEPRTLGLSAGLGRGPALPVPEHSQMVYGADGGNVWCSPTSVSMVLAYWNGYPDQLDPDRIKKRVYGTVDGVYDWIYDGHGNWPFNTAFAATEGMEASVARFTSMNDVEEWVAADVPVVFSWAWKKGEVTDSAVSSSDGHLAVIVGFDGAGNPIVNDPASPTNEDVQRTYNRAELETVWLRASGGTVYLIYPQGHQVPTLD